jgi:nucleotide-binding universal stress UspA family protein
MQIDLKHILCTTDFSTSGNQTFAYGLTLAKTFGASLQLLHVVEVPTASTMVGEIELVSAERQNEMIGAARQQLDELCKALPLEAEKLVSKGHPAEEIVRIARKTGSDLVIVATHGQSGVKRLLLGSVAEALIRTLPCPLLVLRPSDESFQAGGKAQAAFKRILAGSDFSTESNLAIQYALALATAFRAELHLVHVIKPSFYHTLKAEALVPPVGQSHADWMRRNQEKLEKILPKDANIWCSLKTAILSGQPYKALQDYTETHQIDLVVLGARGAGLLKTMLVGSTTERMIRLAPCPVLSVCHPPEEISARSRTDS